MADAVLVGVVGRVRQDATVAAEVTPPALTIGVGLGAEGRAVDAVPRRPLDRRTAMARPLVTDAVRATVTPSLATAAVSPGAAVEVGGGRVPNAMAVTTPAAVVVSPGLRRRDVAGALRDGRGVRLKPAPLEEVAVGVAPRVGPTETGLLRPGVVEIAPGGGQVVGTPATVGTLLPTGVAPRPAGAVGRPRPAEDTVRDIVGQAPAPLDFFGFTLYSRRRRG